MNYERVVGGVMPTTVDGCDQEITAFQSRLQQETLPAQSPAPPAHWGGVLADPRAERRERLCAELRYVIALLQKERSTLQKT